MPGSAVTAERASRFMRSGFEYSFFMSLSFHH
jgi:hypothetical protein